MLYHYVAADVSGKVRESEIEATSLEEVLGFIAKANLKPLSVKPVREIIKGQAGLFRHDTITLLDKVFMTKYLSLMLRVGTDLFHAIDVLIDDFDKPTLKRFLMEIKGNLEKGNPFFVSFQNHPEFFSNTVVNLIKAAESSGNLEQTLADVSRSYEKEQDLRDKIRSALMYPVLLLFVSFGVILLLVTFVLPRVATVFEASDATMPFYSIIIIKGGMFLNQHLVVIAPVAFVVGGGLFMFFSRTKRGKELFSLLVHRTPLVKDLLQKLSLQRFAATLSQLLRAGIPFVTAVEITASAVGDRMFSAALLRIARENVAKGVSINDAFKKETIFPNVVINLVSIGERSGRIDEILGTLAEFYEKEIDTSLKNLVSVVEPLMLVVVGIIVAGIAFSVIVPIYQLVGQYA